MKKTTKKEHGSPLDVINNLFLLTYYALLESGMTNRQAKRRMCKEYGVRNGSFDYLDKIEFCTKDNVLLELKKYV